MINKIKIAGYKSIHDLTIDLKSINILIGSNGVGKTNFISFFKLVHVIYDQRLENYSLIKGADSLLHFGRRKTEKLHGYLEFDEVNAYGFILSATLNNKLFVEYDSTYFNIGKVYRTGGWKEYFLSRNSPESDLPNRGYRIAEYVKDYLSSFRVYHFHDTNENAPLRTTSAIDDNRYLKENGNNLASFLYYLKQEHQISYNRVEKVVHSIAPFFERFILEPRKLSSNEIKLEWVEKNNPETYFDATHLSDGTLRFIALVTLLLQPELPKTIIIDEPELGLHPIAINKLAGLMKSAAQKGCQIIVSTQSVGLVNNFEPEDIITVDRENNQSVFNRLKSEELKEWLDDYSIGELWTKSVIKGQP